MSHRTGTQGGQAASGAGGGQARSGSRLFAALGQLVTRHPWRVIGAWIIVAVAVIATAPTLPTAGG
jgi:RND superfamily putative drug exporter